MANVGHASILGRSSHSRTREDIATATPAQLEQLRLTKDAGISTMCLTRWCRGSSRAGQAHFSSPLGSELCLGLSQTGHSRGGAMESRCFWYRIRSRSGPHMSVFLWQRFKKFLLEGRQWASTSGACRQRCS